MRLLLLLAVAGAGYYLYRQQQLLNRSRSTTNASDAVDDINVPENAGTEEHLDAGVQETFPASDPVSVNSKGETEWERRQRGGG